MTKRALLIGINEFKNRMIPSLNGCVADAIGIRTVLKKFFKVENSKIHCLFDERATKFNILNKLETLMTYSEPGDTIILFIATHGSQVRDRNGDELNDCLDEIICPYDMNWDTQTYITDDSFTESIYNYLPKNTTFEAIFDMCHSGTIIKNGEPINKIRWLHQPLDISLRWEGDKKLSISKLLKSEQINSKSNTKIIWSACSDDQNSNEICINNYYRGAFTYSLLQSIYDGNTIRQKMIKEINKNIKKLKCKQTIEIFVENNEEETYKKEIFSCI
jgi:metacaspase-1